jgi:hypothetical protein
MLHTTTVRAALAAASVAALVVAGAPAAHAKDGDVERRGSCSRATDWKVKVGPEDGRLEVEGEIDSNRRGQTWRWRIVHNGSVSASGTRTTQGPSGSFEVRRLLVNLRGTDTITFRARNPRSGELCRGTVRF